MAWARFSVCQYWMSCVLALKSATYTRRMTRALGGGSASEGEALTGSGRILRRNLSSTVSVSIEAPLVPPTRTV